MDHARKQPRYDVGVTLIYSFPLHSFVRAAVLFAPLRLEDSGPFLVSHGRRSAWWLAAFVACCWLGC